MGATSASRPLREERGMFEKYLKGNGIDVGCGADQLQTEYGSVVGFDKKDGDAQYMERIANDSFDFVYSSHCLEDLENILVGIENWIRILKNGGYLYIVVPDWELYEHKGRLPSKYNPEHNWMFTIKEKTDLSIRLVNIRDLFAQYSGLETIECFINDCGYNYDLLCDDIDQTRNNACAQIEIVLKKMGRLDKY